MLAHWWALALAWCKRRWVWLAISLGLLTFILLELVGRRKKVVITSTALEKADEAKAKIDAKAAEQAAQINAEEAGKLAGISAEHSAEVAASTQRQLDAAVTAQGDPEKVNELLLRVGKDMRE